MNVFHLKMFTGNFVTFLKNNTDDMIEIFNCN